METKMAGETSGQGRLSIKIKMGHQGHDDSSYGIMTDRGSIDRKMTETRPENGL